MKEEIFPSVWPAIPEPDPVRKFILLVLWQAQDDKATELTIGRACPEGVFVRYKVAGQWYTLSPFPANLRPNVVRHLQAMAGMVGNAREGILDQTAGNMCLRWTVGISTPDDELRLIPTENQP